VAQAAGLFCGPHFAVLDSRPAPSWCARDFANAGPLSAQQFPQLTVELRGILRRVLDKFYPFLLIVAEGLLPEQVRSLHDGLERIAQIMGEDSQAGLQNGR